MRTSARGALEVRFQHRRPALGRDHFQTHVLTPPMPERDVAAGCRYVAHPLRIWAKHGNQVPLVGDDDQDERQANDLTRAQKSSVRLLSQCGLPFISLPR